MSTRPPKLLDGLIKLSGIGGKDGWPSFIKMVVVTVLASYEAPVSTRVWLPGSGSPASDSGFFKVSMVWLLQPKIRTSMSAGRRCLKFGIDSAPV